MKPLSLLSQALGTAVLAFAATSSMAAYIDNGPTGLSNPGVTVTFGSPDAPDFPNDTKITTQYASQGVTFDYLYYNPFDDEGPYNAIDGNYLGNYQSEGSAEVVILSISFANPQTRAAFGLASNGGPDGDGNTFTFEALFNGTPVDSFARSVGNGYYGFVDIAPFNQIIVTSSLPSSVALRNFRADDEASSDVAIPNTPDYYLFDNLQFDLAAINPAAVPEPEIAALFALGLAGAAVMRRRSSRTRNA